MHRFGPFTPRVIDTCAAAISVIIIGAKNGLTLSGPFSIINLVCSNRVVRPPIPLPITIPILSWLVVLILIIENLLAVAPHRVLQLLEGGEVVLIRDGVVDHAALRRVNLHESELKSRLRSKGIRSFSQVGVAYLEMDGSISVLRRKRNGKGPKDKVSY